MISKSQFCLVLATAILSSVASNFPEFGWLAWFAWVPLLLCCDGLSLKRIYVYSLLSGTLAYGFACFWVVTFFSNIHDANLITAVLCAFTYWLYAGNSFALIFVLAFFLSNQSKAKMIFAFPTIFVVVNILYPMIFTFELAETQTEWLLALQPIEFLGGKSLSWLISGANSCIFVGWLLLKSKSGGQKTTVYEKYAVLVFTSLVGIWFSSAIASSANWIKNKPKSLDWTIGLVQVDKKANEIYRRENSVYSVTNPYHFKVARDLVVSGADVLIFPESKHKLFFVREDVRKAFFEFVKSSDTNMIFQDYFHDRVNLPGRYEYIYNTAVNLAPDGSFETYRKRLIVPFGEYIPLPEQFTGLRNIVKKYLTGFTVELSRGDSAEKFKIGGTGILPIICYESRFANFVAESVNESRSDDIPLRMIVTLSNNDWFLSEILSQHHNNSIVLRAIENRLPVINAVRSGPSIYVTNRGEVESITKFKEQIGALVEIELPETPKRTLYSKYPDIFLYILVLLTTILVISLKLDIFGAKLGLATIRNRK